MSLSPFSNPDLFDHIVLDGVRSPGVVTLSGHERAVEWDIKKGTGQNGATTERKGEPVGQFTARFDLVNDPQTGDQIEEWRTKFQPVIERSTAGAKPIALPIEHPDLTLNRYTSVVNGGIGGLEHDGRGGASVTVKFLEFRPPKPKGGKPKSSDYNAGVNDDAKKRFDAAREEAKRP